MTWLSEGNIIFIETLKMFEIFLGNMNEFLNTFFMEYLLRGRTNNLENLAELSEFVRSG